MKQPLFSTFLICLVLLPFLAVYGKEISTPVSTSSSNTESDQSSFLTQKQKLELERLELENEKLQLELNQLKTQATQAPTPLPLKKDKSDKAEAATFQNDESKKAEVLAKENKDKDDLLVLDLVNSEVWFKGVRYGIHEVNNLVSDQGWKMSKKVYEYNPGGLARRLYTYQNLTLLKYDGHERGIFALSQPKKAGDLRFLTTGNVTFDSSSGDVRNGFPNLYFKYDGQGERDKLKVLNYTHNRGLNFDDRIEVLFNRQDKMTEIRCGVLGER